jgi:hypothetical protein
MKLSQALAKISGAGAAEKTASAPAVTPVPSSSDAAAETLKQALKEATAPAAPAEKTASAQSPVADLAKLAADVAGAEHEAATKEAQLYGAAVADGFMARLAQYEAASTKVAAAAPAAPTGDSFEKFAAENPDIVKEAHDLGYASTMTDLHKLAEAAYTKGYNETVEQIYKVACDSFVNGFKDTIALLQAASR